jgi:DNA repair exonuclease SbcCD nuclease subunit
VDYVVYLGDLYDNFGLKDLEVERFWQETFDAHRQEVIAIVGNHDRPGDKASQANGLLAHRGNRTYICDHPFVVGQVGFIPYYHSGEEFVEAANDKASNVRDAKVLICHQAVVGAKYDNGFPADGKADTSLVPQQTVISGHLHTAQSFGKVWYPGSPRWRTVHDANKVKSLHVITTSDQTGEVLSDQAFPSACSKLVHLKETEGEEYEADTQGLGERDRLVVDLVGSKAFIEDRRKHWAGIEGTRIRAMPTEQRVSKVKESDGISVAFGKYQEQFKPPRGTSLEVLKKMAKERFTHAR